MSELSRTIFLHNEISNESVQKVIEQIVLINEKDDKDSANTIKFEREPIKLYINTFGGIIYDCLSLCSIIGNSKTPIHAYVGYAMSAGLPITVSCHKRYGYKNSIFHYHGALAGYSGDLKYIETHLNQEKETVKLMDNIILTQTRLTDEELRLIKERREERFFTAEEALELGIIHKILDK